MRWRDDRPYRIEGEHDTFGPGLVFGVDPDSWEACGQEFGDDAERMRQGYRYHRTRNGVVQYLTVGDPPRRRLGRLTRRRRPWDDEYTAFDCSSAERCGSETRPVTSVNVDSHEELPDLVELLRDEVLSTGGSQDENLGPLRPGVRSCSRRRAHSSSRRQQAH
jgi:hypothetical protein